MRDKSNLEAKQASSVRTHQSDPKQIFAIDFSPTRFGKGPFSSHGDVSEDQFLNEKEYVMKKLPYEGLFSPASQDGTEMESKLQSGTASSASDSYAHQDEDLSWERSDEFSQHDFIASDLENDMEEVNNVAFAKHTDSRIAMEGDAGCANFALAR